MTKRNLKLLKLNFILMSLDDLSLNELKKLHGYVNSTIAERIAK